MNLCHNTEMPQKLWHFIFLLWMIVCIWNRIVKAEMSYGMRLKPVSRTLQLLKTPECLECKNRTTFIEPRIHKVESKWDFYNSLKNDKTFQLPNTGTKAKSILRKQPEAVAANQDEPRDNSKRGATFFFTQVEPHRFEYRAMFQHERNIHSNLFQPFVHDFDSFSKEFPPLPKFPTFPTFQEFFTNHHKDTFPNINDFTFPTLSPEVKRAWQPTGEPKPILPSLDIEKFGNPLIKDLNMVLEHSKYPKIFRFNDERINIVDFDRQKKLKFYNLDQTHQNELEPENVKRDHLLILHGGIFTVKEPPLYTKPHVKKRRKTGFRSYRPRL